MVDAVGTAPQTEEINFEDAFAQLALLEEGKEPPKAEEKPEEEQKPAEAAPAAEEKPAEETPPAEEKPAEEAKAPESPPAKSEDTEEVLQRLAKLVKETPQEPQPPQQPQQPQAPALFSKDEEEFLQNYEKDWPDVSRAEALRRKAEYRELVSYVFNEVAKNLTPIVETVQALSQRTHLSDLHTVVEDYDNVRDKVIDWVGKQPAYLQTAYNHVIQNGTAEEVADLVSRYKREMAPASPPQGGTPAPKKTDTELPSATKQAAAALAPVSSKRSAVPQSEPSTFEDAFEVFASKL